MTPQKTPKRRRESRDTAANTARKSPKVTPDKQPSSTVPRSNLQESGAKDNTGPETPSRVLPSIESEQPKVLDSSNLNSRGSARRRTADLRNLSKIAYTIGEARIVFVEDGNAEVIALLPDEGFLAQLKEAALAERRSRQSNARAKLQKQHLEKYRLHKSQLSHVAMKLYEQNATAGEVVTARRLQRLYRSLEAAAAKISDASLEIDRRVKIEGQVADYHCSVAAAALEQVFEECKYLDEPTEFGASNDWDHDFEVTYKLPESDQTLEEEIQQLLLQSAEDRGATSQSDSQAGSTSYAHEEGTDADDTDADAKFDAAMKAQEAPRAYLAAAQAFEQAEEGLENREQQYDQDIARLHRELKANEDPSEAVLAISLRYVQHVRQLTQNVQNAEEIWKSAMKHAQEMGFDAGFDADGFDWNFEHEPAPMLPPNQMPEPRHNLLFEPVRRWHESLPEEKETKMTPWENASQAMEAVNHLKAPSSSPALFTGTSAIVESAQNRALIKDWRSQCEQLQEKLPIPLRRKVVA